MSISCFVLFGLSMALIACDQDPGGGPQDERICAPPYSSAPPTADTVFCANPSVMQRAAVVRVVDGDTLRVTIDGVEEAVRFFGVDTPERGEPCFEEATDRTRGLAHREVLLSADVRDRDRNRRLLRYVYTEDGLSIDSVLISEGLAHAWTADGALRDPLMELEQQARAKGVGCLWNQ